VFTSSSDGIAEVTGTAAQSSQGSSLDDISISPGPNGQTLSTVSDLSGDYDVFIPLGVSGFDYSNVTITDTDAATSAALGSETVSLAGATTSTPIQEPAISTTSTSGENPDTCLIGTWQGTLTNNNTSLPVTAMITNQSGPISVTTTTFSGTGTIGAEGGGPIQGSLQQVFKTDGQYNLSITQGTVGNGGIIWFFQATVTCSSITGPNNGGLAPGYSLQLTKQQ
jgi:hypothetical protein